MSSDPELLAEFRALREEVVGLRRDVAKLDYDLQPDNKILFHEVTGLSPPAQVIKAGVGYKYLVPQGTRSWYILNLSQNAAGTTNGGLLYEIFNQGEAGLTKLPSKYTTVGPFPGYDSEKTSFWLKPGDYMIAMADSACTDPGWEIRFMGRE